MSRARDFAGILNDDGIKQSGDVKVPTGNVLIGKETVTVGTAGTNIAGTSTIISASAGNTYHVYNTSTSTYPFVVSYEGNITSGAITSTGKLTLNDPSVGGWIQSNASIRIDIDNDNNQTDRAFVVSKNNGATDILTISEDTSATFAGDVTVDGDLIITTTKQPGTYSDNWKTTKYVRAGATTVGSGNTGDTWVHLFTISNSSSYDKVHFIAKIGAFDDVGKGTEVIEGFYENTSGSQENHTIYWRRGGAGATYLFKEIRSIRSSSSGASNTYNVYAQITADWIDYFTVDFEYWRQSTSTSTVSFPSTDFSASAPSAGSDDRSLTARKDYFNDINLNTLSADTITTSGQLNVDVASGQAAIFNSGTSNVVADFISEDANVWVNLMDSSSSTYGVLIGHDSTNLIKIADNSVTTQWSIGASGTVTSTGINNIQRDVRSAGQVRATGWWNDAASTDYRGLAFEIGVSGGKAYALSYNRDTTSYGSMEFNANDFEFNNSVTITGNIGINASASSTYPLYVQSGQRYLVGFKNTAADANYPWLVHDSSGAISSFIVHFNGVGDRLTLTENGSLSTSVQGTVWGASNDGSGSGLDADTVDGIQAASFLRSDVADEATMTSMYVFNKPSTSGYQTAMRVGSSGGGLYFTSDNAIITKGMYYNSGWIATNSSGSGIDFASTSPKIFSFSGATVGQAAPVSSSTDIWYAGNDGSGSGLDADLLDGQQGSYYDHRRYTDDDTYLGGYYVSGGTEKPNDTIFGAGKLKIAMLGSSNIGGATWNDVLWMSTYTGGDVKRSTAFVSSKYDNTSVWVNKVNYDSASWGTNYLFWNTGNDGSGSGLDADLLDGNQASAFVLKSGDTMTGQLTISGLSPQMKFNDTDGDDFWIHINSNRFYILPDRDDSGSWETPYAMELNSSTNVPYLFGNQAWTAGNDGSGSGLDADLLDGLDLHTGRNNEVNKVVRTDANGYIQAGWINTTSGSTTVQLNRVYASNDGYIRYYSPSNFLNSGGMGEFTFNNQVRNHSTYTNFNDTGLRAGVNYLQGGTNGPTGSGQWYGFRLGLGTEYGTTTGSSGHYASELYWSRKGQTSNNYYIYTRDMESGTWGSWVKMHAGYADSAGSVAYANVTGTPSLGGGTPYLDLAVGNYGTVKVDDDRGVSWAGYAIRDDWVLMSDGATNCGIYNDTDNEWGILVKRNAEVELFHNGVQRLETTSAGVTISGDCRATIFYDSDNTGYYVNPSSASNINTVTATAYYYASDERLKENISTIPNALEKVEQLRGVEYNLKETGQRQIGVIAQEVEKILPEVVGEHEDVKTVNYGQIVGLLIEAMKEQQSQIENLQKEIGELKNAKIK